MPSASVPHGTASGYSYHGCRCAVCVGAKRDRDAAYYLRNAERRKARAAVYHRANRERMLVVQAAYREANRETVRKAHREYERLNRERALERNRAWRKTDRGRRFSRLNKSRRRNVPYTVEALEWIESLVDPSCHYCGEPATEIDHVIPVARGGTGDRANLVPCCRPCNARKRDMTAEEFTQLQALPRGSQQPRGSQKGHEGWTTGMIRPHRGRTGTHTPGFRTRRIRRGRRTPTSPSMRGRRTTRTRSTRPATSTRRWTATTGRCP